MAFSLAAWCKSFLRAPYAEAVQELEKKIASAKAQPVTRTVSEPVISIVNSVLKNPGRWRLLTEYKLPNLESHTLVDKKLGHRFSVNLAYGRISRSTSTSWMTQDELVFAADSLAPHFSRRFDRLEKFKQIRQSRRLQAQRDKLIKIYAEGNNEIAK